MSTHATPRSAAREPLTRADGSPIRALVVDDEPALGDLLSTVLRYEGWRVETALDGQAAIRAARATPPDDSVLVVGDLTLDEDSHEVARGGDPVSLTATVFELLRFFMRNPRRVLSKAQILDRVCQYDFGGHATIVELCVSYLRRKIDAGRSPMIKTLRGAGYVLKAAEPEAGGQPRR